MHPADSQLPWLLRTWRTGVALVGLNAVAESIGCSTAALSQWETGKRHPDLSYMERLDNCYGADGVLLEMAMSIDTPRALPPREVWAHNFQGVDGPVWAWIRPRSDRTAIRATGTWGPFAIEIKERCTERGCVVTAPVSVANPPAWMTLDEAGWVDFGVGMIPEGLGLPIIDGVQNIELIRDREFLYLVAVGALKAALGLRRVTPRALEGQLRDVAGRLRGYSAQEDVWADWTDLSSRELPAPLPVTSEFTGEQLRQLREARAMSRRFAAQHADALLPGNRFTEDHLVVLERGGAPRLVDFPRARLDVVYRGGGVTCAEAVRCEVEPSPAPSRLAVRHRVQFPDFWVGPVWITFSSSDGDTKTATIVLRWPPWRKRLTLRSGTTVTTRRAAQSSEPLRVYVPPGWRVDAGVGLRPQAFDVNHRWAPDREEDESEILRLYAPAHRRILDLALRRLRGGGWPSR